MGLNAAETKAVARDDGPMILSSAPEGYDALVMADIARARGGLSLFIARDGGRAQTFIDAMRFFAPEVECILFPSWDCLPYDRIGPSPGVSAQRMAVLARLQAGLKGGKPAILVAAAHAVLQRLPPPTALERASYSAKPGADVVIADLERYFAVNG